MRLDGLFTAVGSCHRDRRVPVQLPRAGTYAVLPAVLQNDESSLKKKNSKSIWKSWGFACFRVGGSRLVLFDASLLAFEGVCNPYFKAVVCTQEGQELLFN